MKNTILLFLFLAISSHFYAQNANEFYIKGITQFDQAKFNDAIASFDKAIIQNPDFTDAYLKRGACFAILEDNGKAAKDFSKVLELDPKNMIAYYNRGLAFKKLNQLNRAIIDFSEAIKLDPYNKYAVYNRALVKLRMDDIESACEDLAKAADLGIENAAEIIKYTCK